MDECKPLVCGVCFGTGERNVRGLLRRPEATAIVRAMSRGELRPGDAQAMLKEGRSGMSDQAMPPPVDPSLPAAASPADEAALAPEAEAAPAMFEDVAPAL